jgi:hypothetical protein
VVLEHPRTGSLVLLTDDASVLGWAIGLPADQAAVAPADSLLNLAAGGADTDATGIAAAERVPDSLSPTTDPSDPTPTNPAPRWAGRR